MDYQTLLAVAIGISVLLLFIIRLKIPAFIALLIASIVTAMAAGMNANDIIDTVKVGMGGTLGFVATVVGLGAIFGGILEHTGGAKAIANALLRQTGEQRAPYAMMVAGFLVAIPVFFDVGFIILFPIIVALHRKTKKSIIHYAIPLLAGLAVTHAFIPPTPGPIAVAEIIGANLGWVILIGFVTGLPAAYVSGILYGNYLGNRLAIQLETVEQDSVETDLNNPIQLILAITLLPIVLIIASTLVAQDIIPLTGNLKNIIVLIGHPFSALIIANLMAWYLLGIKGGLSSKQLTQIASKSLLPTGIIILVTGAGGVFKQVLIDTGAGEMIAKGMQEMGISIIIFAFLAATIVRILQGSATVAMITGAGLVAPLLSSYTLSGPELAAIVVAIASGATMVSHLNDSGFWLVKEFLQLSEAQGFRTWTVASTLLGLTGFLLACLVFWIG